MAFYSLQNLWGHKLSVVLGCRSGIHELSQISKCLSSVLLLPVTMWTTLYIQQS